jgi:hypothetical protein
MKLCEYANNLTDMKLLVSVTEKNKKIVYEGKEYHISMYYVSSLFNLFYMVFPIMSRDLQFIVLEGYLDRINFGNVKKIYLDYSILFK